jgi:outer membrane murein-binding lipoprotein Lpp
MSDDAEKLILTMLRRLDAKVEQLAFDVREIKGRLTAAQENLAVAHRRIDRLEHRFDRSGIEE